jgi:hypothetical protein
MADRLVYSSGDPCALVRTLLQRTEGDTEEALRRLLAVPCSRELALQLSIASAHCFGLTQVEFMHIYSRIKRGEIFTLPRPDDRHQ